MRPDDPDVIIFSCSLPTLTNDAWHLIRPQDEIWIKIEKRLFMSNQFENIETVSPEGTFCDTVQVPSGSGDMQLI